MKSWIVIVALLVVGASVLAVRNRTASAEENQAFFERKTGISLPEEITNVDHYDEMEFACTSHYTLPGDSIAAVVEVAGLSGTKPENWQPIFDPEHLRTPWDEVPETGNLLYGTGADESSAWDIVLDMESGSLWTSIYWPDFSGDLPGRALGNNREAQHGGAPNP